MSDPADTFRSLPLTMEQDSEISITSMGDRQCSGLPWDTPELHAMLADMLDPPETDEEGRGSMSGSMSMERAAAVLEGGKDVDRADPCPES